MHVLKRLREAKGLFQKDVASAIGVDRTTYVKYERGDREKSRVGFATPLPFHYIGMKGKYQDDMYKMRY